MALKGTLHLYDVEQVFSVVECEYSFNQTVDARGYVNDGISGGQIVVTIVTPGEGIVLYEWMLQSLCFHCGEVQLITNVNSNKKMVRYILFEDAKCVNLFEYFNNRNRNMMTTRITLQCQKIGFYNEYGKGIALDIMQQKLIELEKGEGLHYDGIENIEDKVGEYLVGKYDI